MSTEAVDGTGTAARLERWREMLSGRGGEQSGARRLRTDGETNVLSGVWLHAAARAEQGLELTPFEEGLLGPLREVLGDEEILGVGRVYREQVAARSQIEILPRSVTSRSLKEGFTQADYTAAIREIGPLVAALPNVAVVDRARLEAGEGIDTAEFKASLAEYGHGITVFTGDSDEGTAGALAAGDFHARLQFRTFFCRKAAGDQGGGRDEIYWTAASNTLGYEHTTRTHETGSVVSGQRYNVAGDIVTGSTAFFDTTFRGGYGSTVITAWEGDQSNAEWYTALGRALTTVVNNLKVQMMFADLLPGTEAFGYLYNAVGLITTLWESLRNYDDLILTRGFTFSRADLAALYHAPNRAWNMEFDAEASRGMGHFILEVGYTGAKPLARPASVRHKILTGTSWTDAATPNWQASSTPALASFNGSLYAVFPDQDRRITWSRLSGTTWSSPQTIPGTETYLPVGLAAHNNRLHCSHVGGSGKIFTASFDGTRWSEQSTQGNYTSVTPALASHNGRLWMVHQLPGTDMLLWSSDGTPNAWRGEAWTPWRINVTATAVSHGGSLLLAHRGTHDDKIHLGTWPAGTSHQPNSNWRTESGPALTVHNNKLTLVHRALEGDLRISRYISPAWEAATPIPGSACLDEAALASHDNKLHLLYRVG
ncbi:hypothetical protein ACWDYJ_26565 [Streptomyces sp. NPDC003042]